MPLDIRSQVVAALDNVNKNPELYTPPKPTIDSRMKYAIGNIPVMLGFGLYNNYNNERNSN